jgi:hypothetical protein
VPCVFTVTEGISVSSSPDELLLSQAAKESPTAANRINILFSDFIII